MSSCRPRRTGRREGFTLVELMIALVLLAMMGGAIVTEGIFHVPGGRFYDRTKPERCYSTPEAAAADGYRPSKA